MGIFSLKVIFLYQYLVLKKSQANSLFGQFRRRKRLRRDTSCQTEESFQNPSDQTLRITQCRQEQYFWVDAALWSLLGSSLWQEFVRHSSAVNCQNWIWMIKWGSKSSHYFPAHLDLFLFPVTLVLWLNWDHQWNFCALSGDGQSLNSENNIRDNYPCKELP